MNPVHCRYCGELLKNWNHREEHILMRKASGGCPPRVDVPPPPISAVRLVLIRKREAASWDLKQMRARIATLEGNAK